VQAGGAKKNGTINKLEISFATNGLMFPFIASAGSVRYVRVKLQQALELFPVATAEKMQMHALDFRSVTPNV